MEDGKDKDFNISVKNALKLRSLVGSDVHLLCAKKPELKLRWLQAFADERIQVQRDRETGQTQFNTIFKTKHCVHSEGPGFSSWPGLSVWTVNDSCASGWFLTQGSVSPPSPSPLVRCRSLDAPSIF